MRDVKGLESRSPLLGADLIGRSIEEDFPEREMSGEEMVIREGDSILLLVDSTERKRRGPGFTKYALGDPNRVNSAGVTVSLLLGPAPDIGVAPAEGITDALVVEKGKKGDFRWVVSGGKVGRFDGGLPINRPLR